MLLLSPSEIAKVQSGIYGRMEIFPLYPNAKVTQESERTSETSDVLSY